MIEFIPSHQCQNYILLKLSDFEWSRKSSLSSQNILISLSVSIQTKRINLQHHLFQFSSLLFPSESVHISTDDCLRLPLTISDLSIDATLTFTATFSSNSDFEAPLGTHTLNLFDSLGRYSSGWHTFKLKPLHYSIDEDFHRNEFREHVLAYFSKHSNHDWLDVLSTRSIYRYFSDTSESDLPLVTLHIANLDLPNFRTNSISSTPYVTSKSVLADEQSFDERPLCQLLSALHADDNTAVAPPVSLIDSLLAQNLNIRPLSLTEKQLIWRARYSDYLRAADGGLLLFLEAIDWNAPSQSHDAMICLSDSNWKLPKTISDALLFIKPCLKSPALFQEGSLIERILNQINTSTIDLFLFPLIQSFRYFPPSFTFSTLPPLAMFLIEEAVVNSFIMFELYWLLSAELTYPGPIKYKQLLDLILSALKTKMSSVQRLMLTKQSRFLDEVTKLADKISHPKFDKSNTNVMAFGMTVREKLLSIFKTHRLSLLGSTSAQPEKAKLYVPTHDKEVCDISECVKVYPSNFYPVRFSFLDLNDDEFSFIFKRGDDIRQDYFILKLILLTDKLLKNSGIDAKLTPYRAIPIGHLCGIIEFIPNCKALSEYSKEELFAFLRQTKVYSSRINNFTISCAAYSIITFCFGIRDRHLDNLLLSEEGRLFHIDFGYMLDIDPKPFQTAIRMDERWVYAMGEEYFAKFREYCCLVFSVLRRHANLFLAMFSLIGESGMTSVEKAGRAVVSRVAEKFRLDLSEEEAQGVVFDEIDMARRAIAPKLAETIHRWNQMLRSPTI
ncbi:hypothetical protein GEMRC1_012981 [Eukaryota sp. GEM-RC1]